MKFDRLRQLLLQNAIEGRLVPQIDEEPAVEQIGDSPEEVPFSIPGKWKWVQLQDVVKFNPTVLSDDGNEVSFIPMTNVSAGYVNYFTNSELKQWSRVKSGFSKFANGDVIMAKITPCFQNRKSCIVSGLSNWIGAGSTEFHVMRPLGNIVSDYLLWFIKTAYLIKYGVENFNGTAGQQRIGTKNLKKCLIPLPPLDEQRRIVARLNELLATIKQAEDAAVDLDRLSQNLREKILQKAIEGKLVPQRDDEPAVEQIGEAPEEVPFEIPEKWKWVPLETLGVLKTGRTPDTSNKKLYGVDIPFIKPGDIGYDHSITFRKDGLSFSAKSDAIIASANSILMVCIGGSIGKCSIIHTDASFNQQINSITCLEFVDERYLFSVFSSKYFQNNIKMRATGTATPILNKKSWGRTLVPLPTLEEQRRIVARLNELLPEVEKLKTHL